MGKILGVILLIAIGFGGGWFARSYRATSACVAANGTFDTNRSVCVGAETLTPTLTPGAGSVTAPPS